MRTSSERPTSYRPVDSYGEFEGFEPYAATAAQSPRNPGFNPATPLTQSIPPQPAPLGTLTRQGPPTVMSSDYIPGYLANNIGRNIRAEFVIGTNTMTDRTGVLKDVGVNYFVIRDENTRSDVMADLYSVKFVTVFD